MKRWDCLDDEYPPGYALPFCHLQIRALCSPYPNRWDSTQTAPPCPKTLGERLKRRRLYLHRMQADLADRLGVHVESLKNWERGATEPRIRYRPKIVEFLGYDPESEPENDAARIVHLRRQLGLTQKQLARLLAIDAVTLYRWENSIKIPLTTTIRQIKQLLSAKLQLTRQ